MFCSACGAKHSADAVFCQNCGRPIAATRKNRNYEKNEEVTSGVGGWLLFLCISLVFISPFWNLIVIISELHISKNNHNSSLSKAIAIEVLCLIMLAIYGIVAGSKLWAIRRGAIQTAKSYFIVNIIYSALFPFVFLSIVDFSDQITEKNIGASIGGVIASSVVAFIVFYYFRSSKRIRSTYPTPETHVACPDCRNLIDRTSSSCNHCGCKLIPQ